MTSLDIPQFAAAYALALSRPHRSRAPRLEGSNGHPARVRIPWRNIPTLRRSFTTPIGGALLTATWTRAPELRAGGNPGVVKDRRLDWATQVEIQRRSGGLVARAEKKDAEAVELMRSRQTRGLDGTSIPSRPADPSRA